MSVSIRTIEYFLPEKQVSNQALGEMHPDWDVDKVGEKSGVFNRHISEREEKAFDLACKALEKLFATRNYSPEDFDGIIFCTQSPDYIMPSNAFLVHKKFAFREGVWAFDYNLACSGYVYGLAIVRGMIQTGMGKRVLLINADTYSKFINPNDRSTSVLFGDAATVTVIEPSNDKSSTIIDLELASSGGAYDSFYIPDGGMRNPLSESSSIVKEDHSGNQKAPKDIHMNGFAVWKFISRKVPHQIKDLLSRNQIQSEDLDLVVFHQASKLTIDSLVKALKIDSKKVFLNLDKVGNTVSASIPLALKFAEEEGRLKRGDLVLISGFGVGLSWGSLIIRY